MITLQGKGVSPGIDKVRLYFLKRKSHALEKQPINNVDQKIAPFNAAWQTASEQLDQLSTTMADKIKEENAALFEIHRMILQDTDYCDLIITIIRTEKVCAEYAVNGAVNHRVPYFKKEENPALGMRAIRICLTRASLFKTQ